MQLSEAQTEFTGDSLLCVVDVSCLLDSSDGLFTNEPVQRRSEHREPAPDWELSQKMRLLTFSHGDGGISAVVVFLLTLFFDLYTVALG